MFSSLIIASCLLGAGCSSAHADLAAPLGATLTHAAGIPDDTGAPDSPAVSNEWVRDLPLIRKAYLESAWSDLARLVIGADADLDLTYFYLDRSAEGLSYASAAKIYYVRARNAPNCIGPFETCHGYSPNSNLEPRLAIGPHLEMQAGSTSLQQLVTLSSRIWTALSDEQRNMLETRYVVDVLPERNYGMIVHIQTVNESTPGSTAGSQLGARYASATYVTALSRGLCRIGTIRQLAS